MGPTYTEVEEEIAVLGLCRSVLGRVRKNPYGYFYEHGRVEEI